MKKPHKHTIFLTFLIILQSCYITKTQSENTGYAKKYFETEIISNSISDIENSKKGELKLFLTFLLNDENYFYDVNNNECFSENAKIILENKTQSNEEILIDKAYFASNKTNKIEKQVELESGVYNVYLILNCQENATTKIHLGDFEIIKNKRRNVSIKVNRIQITADGIKTTITRKRIF